MSRDPRTRRLTRPPADRSQRTETETAETAAVPLLSLLAHATRLTDVLPQLHQRALDATAGTCSLLFEQNPANAVLQATSGFALDELRTDPWLPAAAEAALVAEAFNRRRPTLIGDLDGQMPDLASRLRGRSALLFPLLRGTERAGLLAIGLTGAPESRVLHGDAAEITDGFLTALELFRFRQKDELVRALRELAGEFTSRLAATLNISEGLEGFCHGANRLFGARRTEVWVVDRSARSLMIQACSDPGRPGPGARADIDDASPAAAATRAERAAVLPSSDDPGTCLVTVPLRGCRRALGAVVFEGVRIETGDELDLLDRADELGRQLAGAIENTQLLEDLIRSRRELENTFDSIAHLVVVCDQRGRIVRANDAFASRLQQTRAMLVTHSLNEFIGPDLRNWLSELETAGPRSGDLTPAAREVNDPILKGRFMVTVTDLLDHDRQRAGRVIVARDLTPQSELEAEREELRQRLTQSDKLAALGQFVAGIAHELNNPLQGVLGHLELLRVTGAFPKHLRREVQTVYREADRAAKIVRNLLVFAGSRRLMHRSVSLNAVLHKIAAVRQDACRAQQIELVRHYNEHLPRVQSDPLLLHQVFLNMVMNAEQAIAATGKPGRIEITTTASPAGDRIIVTVRDSGKGIPPDSLIRIFEPFYTTKDVGKGIGLGLAIAYGIVQEHGGRIAAANHPEGGAMFTVELPIGSRHD